MRQKHRALALIVICAVVVVAYKFGKAFLRDGMGLSPQSDYYVYESMSTIMRAINSLFGVGAVLFFLAKPREQFKIRYSHSVLLMTIGLAVFFLIKVITHGPPLFIADSFGLEIVFNGFTGISEEFLWRGCLLLGLAHFMSLGSAIFVSTFFFTAWHFDAVSSPISFVFIFAASLTYSLAFARGVSLLTLSLLHFAWDQIHFGWLWQAPENRLLYDVLLIALEFSIAGLLWYRRPREFQLPEIKVHQGKDTVE